MRFPTSTHIFHSVINSLLLDAVSLLQIILNCRLYHELSELVGAVLIEILEPIPEPYLIHVLEYISQDTQPRRKQRRSEVRQRIYDYVMYCRRG